MKKYISEGLLTYLETEKKPWHMPGHKRKPVFSGDTNFQQLLNQCFQYDVTEVPGLDDFHSPEEMMLGAEQELEALYGTDFSRYLVNGATSGILSADFACADAAPYKKETDMAATAGSRPIFLVARNCHKSVFHAMELCGADIIYLYPEEKNSLYGGITKSILEGVLRNISKEKLSRIAGCVITSPTYEGILSDVAAISRILHFYNIPLIVDEAHGAHFSFIKKELLSEDSFYVEDVYETLTLRKDENLYSQLTHNMNYGTPSAVDHGADIVIQSLHKTLPSFTQTAVIHCRQQLSADYAASLKKYLTYFQTSSPSYIFLMAMEQCISYCDENRSNFVRFYKNIFQFRKAVAGAGLKNISLFSGDTYFDQPYFFDPSRIVLLTESGERLKRLLEENYGIVVEMAGNSHVTIISTISDDEADFDYLLKAILDVDSSLQEQETIQPAKSSEGFWKEISSEVSLELILSLYPKIGTLSEHSYYVYPPGVPIIAANEIITDDMLQELTKHVSQGRKIHIL